MEPRRSRRLAGESSSGPPPQMREFWSPVRNDDGSILDHEEVYRKLLKKKHVPGRWIQFNKFAFRTFNAKLQTMGWEDFLTQTVKGEYYPRLISQFYANFKTLGDNMYCTLIKGQEIILTPALLQQTLLIPDYGIDLVNVRSVDEIENPPLFNEVFSGRITAFAKDLIPEARMMHKVICANIITKRGNFDRITEDALKVLYCFMRGIQFNLAALILDRMSEAANAPSLPYGCIITRVLRYFNVDLSGEQAMEPEVEFNARSLSLMGIQEIEEEEEAEPIPSPPASQEIPAAQAVSNAEIMAELVRQSEEMKRIRKSQKRLHKKQGVMMKTLKSIARTLGCTSERSVEVSQREPLIPSQERTRTVQGSGHTHPVTQGSIPTLRVSSHEEEGSDGSSESMERSPSPTF